MSVWNRQERLAKIGSREAYQTQFGVIRTYEVAVPADQGIVDSVGFKINQITLPAVYFDTSAQCTRVMFHELTCTPEPVSQNYEEFEQLRTSAKNQAFLDEAGCNKLQEQAHAVLDSQGVEYTSRGISVRHFLLPINSDGKVDIGSIFIQIGNQVSMDKGCPVVDNFTDLVAHITKELDLIGYGR